MNNTIANASLEQLEKIGGKLWEKHGSRRVYFNNLNEIFGLYATFYNTGNIQAAWLDGETISNTRANKISGDLAAMKLWVELADGSVQVRTIYRQQLDYDYERRLTRKITESLQLG